MGHHDGEHRPVLRPQPALRGEPARPSPGAAREIEEETGYRAGAIAPLFTYKPLAGISTMHYTVYRATDLTEIGQSTDRAEAVKVEWIPLDDLPRLAADGQITDGPSMTALASYRGMRGQSQS